MTKHSSETQMLLHRVLSALLLLVLMGLVSACGAQTPTLVPTALPPTQTPPPTRTPIPSAMPMPRVQAADPANQAYVRLVHGISDLSALNADLDGLRIASNLLYLQATPPMPIEGGTYRLNVRPSAGSAFAEPLYAPLIEVKGGQTLTLVLVGTAAAPQALPFNDVIAALGDGLARVTLYNASGADVRYTLNAQSANVAAGAAVSAEVTPNDAGVSLVVNEQERLVRLIAQNNTTLVLLPNGEAAQFDVPMPGASRVRLLNGSSAYPTATITADGMEQAITFTGDYARSTSYQTLPSGAYRFALGAVTVNATLQAQTDYAVLLIGTQDSAQLIVYTEDNRPTAGGLARVTFVNIAPQLPSVRVSLGGVGDLGATLYGQAPLITEFAAGTQSLFWSDDRSSPMPNNTHLIFEAGRAYTYLFTGETDVSPLIFSESVGQGEALAATDEPPSAATDIGDGQARLRLLNATTSDASLTLGGERLVLAPAWADVEGQALALPPAVVLAPGQPTLTLRFADGQTLEINENYEPNAIYTLVVYLDEQALTTLFLQDAPFTGDNNAMIRVINLRDDGSGVRLNQRVQGQYTPLIRQILAGQVQTTEQVVDSYVFEVRSDADNAVLERFFDQVLQADGRYDFVLLPQSTLLLSQEELP
jgi:hypothetical protein